MDGNGRRTIVSLWAGPAAYFHGGLVGFDDVPFQMGDLGVSRIGVPPNHPLKNRVFHYNPSILGGFPLFLETPICRFQPFILGVGSPRYKPPGCWQKSPYVGLFDLFRIPKNPQKASFAHWLFDLLTPWDVLFGQFGLEYPAFEVD